MILEQRQSHRRMEQYREHRNKPMLKRTIIKEVRIYNGEGTVTSINGVGITE